MTTTMTLNTPATSPRPASGRRVTTTGRRLLPANATHAQVLAARRGGVSSSDAPVITGSARGSIVALYCDKTGAVPLDQRTSENAAWSLVLKDAIAAKWAQIACTKVERAGLLTHVDEPWMLTSLDRLVLGCPAARTTKREGCALHIYCRDAHDAPRFASGALPTPILDESLWKLAVTGLDHIHLMVLIGGNDGRRYTVRAADHRERFDRVMSQCRTFWEGNVIAGVCPTHTGSERPEDRIELCKRLHRERAGTVELGEKAEQILAHLHAAEAHGAAKNAAGKAEERFKAALIEALGAAQTALLNGEEAYSYKAHPGQPVADFETLREQFPDAYQRCERPGADVWRLYPAKAFRLQTDSAT